MKPIFILIAIAIIAFGIYNTQIKNKTITDINRTELSNELNISSGPITDPTELARSGVEMSLATMCEKAGGTLLGDKCYEGKGKAVEKISQD